MVRPNCQVVLQTAFLGDLFLSLPLLVRLRQLYPQDQLILICKAGLGEYFLKNKIVDQVFEVKKNNRNSYIKVNASLQEFSIQNLFCIHRSVRSQLFSMQIRAKRKIGFKSLLGNFVFDQQLKYQSTWPEPLRQLFLISEIDVKTKNDLASMDWSYLSQASKDGELPQIPAVFAATPLLKVQEKKRIAIFPGSVWATKKWTVEGFAAVVEHFLKKNYEVTLMGGPDEKKLCELIKTQTPTAKNSAGDFSITQSVEYIKTCALVICNDSAPAHMAASQGTPVVTLFGPTTLNLGFRPWITNARVVQNNELHCRPCGKHGHQKCPLRHHHCMTQITSEKVIAAALELLTATR